MRVLNEDEAEEFLEENGFPIVKRELVKSLKGALDSAEKIGYPIVLKNPKILHKTEKNAVKICTRDNIKENYNSLNSKEVLVQKFVEGNEILIGLKKDLSFGHVIAFGLGGIFSEVLKDVSFRICPVKEKDIDEMIKEIKGYKILLGVRGQKAVNIDRIKEILKKISNLSEKYPEIIELDINPLIVGKDVEIVDARIVME